MARSDKGARSTGKGSPAPAGRTGGGGKAAGRSAKAAGGGKGASAGDRPAARSARAAERPGRAPAGAADRSAAAAKPTKEEKRVLREAKKEEKRGRFGRRLLKIGFLRRRYIKRVLRSIEKSKEKGKRMPPELWDLSKRLDRLPPAKRAEFLEQAITAGPAAQEQAGRAMRRAAASQERQSGRGGGRSRPGMGPMPPGTRRGRPR
jgi:hypothetical protein